MTRLSVNINKIATLRNSRGADMPNVVNAAINAEKFGAEGITVHPRPDERHITYQDVDDLSKVVTTEFNIEGYPNKKFMELVLKYKPTQVTLVPDAPDAITSNAGWNTIDNKSFLSEIVQELRNADIRTSIFVDPDPKMVEAAANIKASRVELYTEPYAAMYSIDRDAAIKDYIEAADVAYMNGLAINAGHDLNLENLAYFAQQIPILAEVSIGHALISDAIYLGMELTILKYKECLRR
ncbi:pyridoxine 5'-phosphate synthase [Halosquirtibacter xylanolyticus]|uniref:pyridoxine 5'-phosphate synthase n=1 Tax=Halosquirtibacter xylanolyticus TaxID=3374599 RepID=UPI00374796C9|nr:pyridoxine 5'-phosphate synthase [Prolixibacteraceae bacterium]